MQVATRLGLTKFTWSKIIIVSNIFWTILSKGERCNEVNPTWSTKTRGKTRPQHRELRVLLFAVSVCVLSPCNTEDAGDGTGDAGRTLDGRRIDVGDGAYDNEKPLELALSFYIAPTRSGLYKWTCEGLYIWTAEKDLIDHRKYIHNLWNWSLKKTFRRGLSGIWTRDHYDTGTHNVTSCQLAW